jgi:hypothetical protein
MSLVLALLLSAAAAGSASARLSRTYPPEVPHGPVIAAWERIAGESAAGEVVVAYELWVNPRRSGLYEITRYRGFRRKEGRLENDRAWREILLWNPGPNEPLRCFERVAHRRFWTLGLVRHWRWERIPPNTDRLREEMMRAMQVYGLHRQNLGLGPFE